MRLVASASSLAEAGRELGAGVLLAVLRHDPGRLPEHLGQRPVGDAVAVGQAAAPQYHRLVGDAPHELLDEAALADPGLAEQRDEPALGPGDRTTELRVQGGDLAGAPDERQVRRSGARRAFGDREQPVGRDGFRLALQRQGLDRHDLDGVSDQPVGGLADQDLPSRGRLLETGGDVHRVAGGQALGGAALTGDDFAGVDAGPVLQGDPELGSEGDVELRQRLAHSRRPLARLAARRPRASGAGRRPP